MEVYYFSAFAKKTGQPRPAPLAATAAGLLGLALTEAACRHLHIKQ